jgi:diaminopropionate ammonia-lyase
VAAQTGGLTPDLVIASVGAGSWAAAVAVHYKSSHPKTRIVTVEPDCSACFKESLHCGRSITIDAGETIMNGMCCGTPSSLAWPILRDGAYAAVTVTEKESHNCVEYLQSRGVNAGPCGAATVAALKRLCSEGDLPSKKDLVVVLFSTEGWREYEVPTS